MVSECPFSPEELKTMRSAMSQLAVVTMRHSRGIMARAWEAKSLVQFFMKVKTLYPENGTIQRLFSQQDTVHREGGMPDPFGQGEKGDADEQQCFLQMARVRDLVDERLSFDEAAEVKSLFYKVAFEIASAAGDGFFGTGKRVNEAEEDFLRRLKTELLEPGETND